MVSYWQFRAGNCVDVRGILLMIQGRHPCWNPQCINSPAPAPLWNPWYSNDSAGSAPLCVQVDGALLTVQGQRPCNTPWHCTDSSGSAHVWKSKARHWQSTGNPRHCVDSSGSVPLWKSAVCSYYHRRFLFSLQFLSVLVCSWNAFAHREVFERNATSLSLSLSLSCSHILLKDFHKHGLYSSGIFSVFLSIITLQKNKGTVMWHCASMSWMLLDQNPML